MVPGAASGPSGLSRLEPRIVRHASLPFGTSILAIMAKAPYR